MGQCNPFVRSQLPSPFWCNEVEDEKLIPTSPLPSLPGTRAVTPRGFRFPSLDEAHRSITSRTHGNIPDTSQAISSRKSSSAEDTASSDQIPLRDLSSPGASGAYSVGMWNSGRVGDFPIASFRRPTRDHSANLSFSVSAVDTLEIDNTHSCCNSQGQDPVQESVASDNAVNRIYRQYEAKLRTPGLETRQQAIPDSQTGNHIPNHSDFRNDNGDIQDRNGATNRCGFRQDETELDPFSDSETASQLESLEDYQYTPAVNKTGDIMERTSFNPNWIFPPLSPYGTTRVSTPTLRSQGLSDIMFSSFTGQTLAKSNQNDQQGCTVRTLSSGCSNTDILFGDTDSSRKTENEALNEMSDEDEASRLHPLPLSTRNLTVPQKHFSYLSGTQNASGVTTDSDDDPFKYDKQSYTIFLKPSKEREISAALGKISGLGRHSIGTLCSSGTNTQDAESSASPVPLKASQHEGRMLAKSIPPRQEATLFDTSVVKPTPFGTNAPRAIEVVANVGPLSLITGQPPINDLNALTNTNLGLDQFSREENGHNIQNDGDWETVASGGTALGHSLLAMPPQALLRNPFIKFTGSSIADVSDNSSLLNLGTDEFDSTQRIIKHPSCDSLQTFRVRSVRGMKAPVLLAKQPSHRVNGFAQDSGRVYSVLKPSLKEPNTYNSLMGKLANPLRQLGARRLDQQSYLEDVSPKKSRFDSSLLKNLSMGKKHRAEEELPTQPPFKRRPPPLVLTSESPDHLAPPRTPLTTGNDSFDSDITGLDLCASHNFSFSLVSLPDAARHQALRRASGEDDQTETGTARAKRALSQSSSRKFSITSPNIANLPQIPEFARRRDRGSKGRPLFSPMYKLNVHSDGRGQWEPNNLSYFIC
jgi:hypothetical protein